MAGILCTAQSSPIVLNARSNLHSTSAFNEEQGNFSLETVDKSGKIWFGTWENGV
ncbi:MAG: hypothetical protein JSS78_04695 [Bacteroidetes bacterium]|nr:hypothetical protein [Bacteroidota bacterium]